MRKEKLLSICIPTYNRKKLLENHLKNIFSQLGEFPWEDVEVIVSVNPSQDGTEAMVKELEKVYDFTLNINDTNIGGTPNIIKAMTLASGKYVWIAADDDILLPETLKKVVFNLREHSDLAWMFINAARTKIVEENGKRREVLVEPKCYWRSGGYFKDGLEKLNSVFKEVDNRVLFSTANVYLREAALEIANKFPKTNNCRQLAYVYNSIKNGSAYIIDDTCIIAGCETTWSDRYYETEVRYFNEALLLIDSLAGYPEGFGKSLVKYRMTHEAIDVWFLIYKEILKNPKRGLKDLYYYFKLMPGLTSLMLVASPFEAMYLIIRHSLRVKKRKESLEKLKEDKNTIPQLLEYC